ncbi:MAG: NAD(+) synthase [Promicromonosporaceae bacterium]|nr:NAD(+) synthase [Promicromonosporaceae bacterium]
MDYEFWSAYSHGFARVAAVTVPVTVADPAANVTRIIEQARACHEDGVAVAVFPELSLTGYAIDDLLLADPLLDAAQVALAELLAASAELRPVLVIGAPLRSGNRLYNCAVVIHAGRVLGVAPKSYVPNYREFYERRWFAPGDDQRGGTITVCGQDVPFGPDLIFAASDVPGLSLHVEVCEDMWVPVPTSAQAALAGATVLANLSGSPITVARADDRRLLVRSASVRCLAACVYAAAGPGESTTDLAFDGQTMIYEVGELLAETDRFPDGPRRAVADVDLDRLRQERLRQGTFDDNRRALSVAAAPSSAVEPHPVVGRNPVVELVETTHHNGEVVSTRRSASTQPTEAEAAPTLSGHDTASFCASEASRRTQFHTVPFTLNPPRHDIGLRRPVARFPFVPSDAARLAQDCSEAYRIQVSALQQRLTSIGSPKIVIGVSGGLDSTHALIVAAKAMDLLGRPRSDILAYTLPGFATSTETRERAWRLSESLGVTCEEIDIRPTATQMLRDMNHPFAQGEPVYDVTFENVQAGLRTDYLFRLANHRGGIVLGTGDLSELALGWCTYGVGDHMSMYGINAGVPKTLIQHLIRWVAATGDFTPETSAVLLEILGQEISPELVPADADGALQSTQAQIGPYELQDNTLYWTLRYGLRPSKIAFLQWHAWHDAAAGMWPPGFPVEARAEYNIAEIKKWLDLFYRRFFANQFKRTCLPNGPKVLSGGSLSPRGDWRMPADANPTAWLTDLARVPIA